MIPKTPIFWKEPSLTGYLLSPLSVLYYGFFLLRKWLSSPVSFPVPVICVGNVTAGGSGKTPVAIALAKLLKSHGYRVAFLSRGYGSKCKTLTLVNPATHRASEVGDEPLLLAKTAPCFVCPDRKTALNYICQHQLDFIITDDGLQDFSIRPALSLLVMDSHSGSGNGLLLPAGPLREPVSSILPRVQAVVIRSSGQKNTLPDYESLPVLTTSPVYPAAASLRGKRVMAFAGIGNPQQFFDSLRSFGCDLVSSVAFPDHYYYTQTDTEALLAEALAADAVLVTTEKDRVRLQKNFQDQVTVSPLELTWDNPEQLLGMVKGIR